MGSRGHRWSPEKSIAWGSQGTSRRPGSAKQQTRSRPVFQGGCRRLHRSDAPTTMRENCRDAPSDTDPPGAPPRRRTVSANPRLRPIAALVTTPAFAQKKNPDGTARVLLLARAASGGRHGGYREQAYAPAPATLEGATGRYRAVIVGRGRGDPRERPRHPSEIWAGDPHGGSCDEEFKFTAAPTEALLDFVEGGPRFSISIHGADNAGEGLDSRRLAARCSAGVSLARRPARQQDEEGRTSRSRWPTPANPITRGVAGLRHLSDELYYQHPDAAGRRRRCCTIDYDGRHLAVAWTRTYGTGRVFHTPLGHRDFEPRPGSPTRSRMRTWLRVLLQGIDWVAAGKDARRAGANDRQHDQPSRVTRWIDRRTKATTVNSLTIPSFLTAITSSVWGTGSGTGNLRARRLWSPRRSRPGTEDPAPQTLDVSPGPQGMSRDSAERDVDPRAPFRAGVRSTRTKSPSVGQVDDRSRR